MWTISYREQTDLQYKFSYQYNNKSKSTKFIRTNNHQYKMAPVKDEHKDLPLVPESVLKKRHDLDDIRRRRAAQEEDNQKKSSNKQRGGSYVKKPATFLAKAKQRRNEQIRYRRVKKKGMQKRASKKTEIKTKEIALNAEDKDSDDDVDSDDDASEDATNMHVIQYKANSVGSPYVFVIRIREDAGQPPRNVLNILLQLRLKEANTGIFLRYTEITKRHLHLVEPWVVYGKPSDGLVGDLMGRKSFGTVKGEKVPLSDNTIIENALGNDHGLICMEDLVHELINGGKSFDVVAKFLTPFPLSATRSRFEKNLLQLKQGKDYGDRGEEIDEFIKQML